MFSYKGVSEEKELEDLLKGGWSATMNEAMGEKVAKKVAPKVEKAPIEELEDTKIEFTEEPKVESRQFRDLTDDEKAEIKKRLDAGDKPGEIGKSYNVHHLVVVRVKRELD